MTGDQTVRATSNGVRAVYIVGCVLVFAAGFQLFVLTDHTAKWFAWTIRVPITAAFLGAFYWTALALAWLSARERVWARARVGMAGVFVFISLTLVATLLHLDQFHFHSSGSVARGAAYLWLVVYAVDPPAVLLAWVLQVRKPGVDPSSVVPLSSWFRWAAFVHSLVSLGVGVILFAAPGTGRVLWPWPLTPLTARAVASWLIGLGLVIASAIHEDDWVRIRPATAAYAALGALQLVALARYGDEVHWGTAAAWAYLAIIATVVVVGGYGWLASGRVARATRVRG